MYVLREMNEEEKYKEKNEIQSSIRCQPKYKKKDEDS
jgi:hypothetical protein